MPNLDAEVINEPKKQFVRDFNKEEVIQIVQNAIDKKIINLGDISVVQDPPIVSVVMRYIYGENNEYLYKFETHFLSTKETILEAMNNVLSRFTGEPVNITDTSSFNGFIRTLSLQQQLQLTAFMATFNSYNFLKTIVNRAGEGDAEPVVLQVLPDGYLGNGVIVSVSENLSLSSLLQNVAASNPTLVNGVLRLNDIQF